MANPLVQLTELCEELLAPDPIEFSRKIGELMQDVENNNLIDSDKMEGFITFVLGLMGVWKFSTKEQRDALHAAIYQSFGRVQDQYFMERL